jgi:hypothetical protein
MRVYERIAARNQRMTGKEFSSAISGPLILILFLIVVVALVV